MNIFVNKKKSVLCYFLNFNKLWHHRTDSSQRESNREMESRLDRRRSKYGRMSSRKEADKKEKCVKIIDKKDKLRCLHMQVQGLTVRSPP